MHLPGRGPRLLSSCNLTGEGSDNEQCGGQWYGGLAWSSSAGNLQLLASSSSGPKSEGSGAQLNNPPSSMMRTMASRRSRDSSTGSSTGSNDFNLGSSPSMKKGGLGNPLINASDELIATEAFDLMVTTIAVNFIFHSLKIKARVTSLVVGVIS